MCSLQYFPFAIVALILATATICFHLAYFKFKHVTYVWPYISDTGAFPPESCIFAQGLNMVAFTLFLAMYIKYTQVKEIYKIHNIIDSYNINKIVFWVGMILCFGITLVANFQETNVFYMHMSGAIMTFGGASIYICLQTYIYVVISPVFGQRKTTLFRIFLSVVAVVTFIVQTVAGVLAFRDFTGNDMTKWTEQDGGYDMHQMSTQAEWICACSAMIYVSLFTREFRDITLKPMEINFQKENTSKDVNC